MIETVSGKCPSCGYDKMISRFGNGVLNVVEGCARCGLGYSSVCEDGTEPNEMTWRDYMIHILSQSKAPEIPESLHKRLNSGDVDAINDEEYLKYNQEFYTHINNKRIQLFKLSNVELRTELKLYLNDIERTDEVIGTIFTYSDNEINHHRNNMILI